MAERVSILPPDAPVWVAPFRPFFLLATLYGPFVLLAWLGAHLGLYQLPGTLPTGLWHAHEMFFGFAAAIIGGFVPTALPGWAGTPEIERHSLLTLVAFWLLGRAAFWMQVWLPIDLVGLVDSVFFLLLAGMLIRMLHRVKDRRYYVVVPIVLGFFVANVWYYGALAQVDYPQARDAVMCAVYLFMILFSLVGGFLTPVFTGNALAELGRGGAIRFSVPLEYLAFASVVLFAISGVADLGNTVSGSIALFAAVVHGARMVRWRGWQVMDVPIVFAMHLGYGWFVVCLLTAAAHEWLGVLSESSAIHAYTIGAFGLMKLGLMTRVVLKHTGRVPHVGRYFVAGTVFLILAAIYRWLWQSESPDVLIAVVLMWVVVQGGFFTMSVGKLLTRSLPAMDDR